MSGFDFGTEGKKLKTKFVLLAVLMGLAFLLYLGNLFSMQVIETFAYQDRASHVSNRSQIISSQRGEIFDRHVDQPIATNRTSFAIQVTPGDLQDNETRARLVSNLASYLQYDESYIDNLVPPVRRTFERVTVLTDVPFESIAKLAENVESFPALSWIQRPERVYPFGPEFSHILGYVGDISQQELQTRFNLGYTSNSVIGKAGVERQLDEVIRGIDGLGLTQVDVYGRRIDESVLSIVQYPKIGQTAVLTIDTEIQQLARRAIGRRTGTALVLKPATGEVLAMVSSPGYDPSSFYGANGRQNFAKLTSDPTSPFLNRNIQAAGPPASTFKILMSIAAMQEKVIDPLKTIRCNGFIRIGDREFKCWDHAGHGNVNLYDALAFSCNVYFYTIGYEYLGEARILEYANRLGLGDYTGIDLPGEIRGLVPSKEWKERTFNAPWVGGDTINLSIGQGFLTVTPIQLANLVAAVVNGGTVYKPHVLKETRDSISGQVISRVEPEILRQITLSQETLDIVKREMREVISRGTANVAVTTRAVQIAGKTGTGQTSNEADQHSWFVAYGPYNYTDPNDVVVVVVWIDPSNEWDWWAPKAANFIFHGIFTGKNYDETFADLSPIWYGGRAREMALVEE